MTLDLDTARWLAEQSSGAVVGTVALWLYHSAFVRERRHNAETRERLEKREDRIMSVLERNAAALEKHAAALDGLSQVIAGLADHVAAKVEHNLRDVVYGAVLHREGKR